MKIYVHFKNKFTTIFTDLELFNNYAQNPYSLTISNYQFDINDVSGIKFIDYPSKLLPDLSLFTNVQWIDFSNNNIISASDLPFFAKLISLNLCNNSLSNTTLPDLSQYPMLSAFYCEGNNLTSLDALQNVDHLVHFKCCNNQLTDDGIKILSSCQKLVVFYGNNNKFTPYIINLLAHNTQLANCQLSGNKITSILPLTKCTNLINLNLANNYLTTNQIPDFSNFTQLKYLRCEDNFTSQPIKVNTTTIKKFTYNNDRVFDYQSKCIQDNWKNYHYGKLIHPLYNNCISENIIKFI